ncbi:hypothetical protein [Streptomyces sp. NRRL S-31]|uniref:hypothetical protein n=1 Tax=Streptomyces sp. NRRL S-31 TaxID=1463898 RepID=UPI00069A10FA|nr:hypothetical protein [Streptomyces sp. NRRL S-31]
MDRDGPVQPQSWRLAVAQARASGSPLPPLVPDGIYGLRADAALTAESNEQPAEISEEHRRLNTVLNHQWAVTEPSRLAHLAAPGEVDAEMLDWLEATGAELIRLATERRRRTRHLLDAHLTTVTDFISESRYTPAAGQRLHTLAASLSQAIAWQHFDERRHASAGRFWHAALHNAHTAHQRDLGAGILSDLA